MEDSSENDKKEGRAAQEPQTEAMGSGKDSSLEWKEKAEKALNDYLYLKADFENYKKRVLKEQSELRKYGSEHLVRALLDVVDNFERAMSVEIKPESLKTYSDGMNMIYSELRATLNKFGVTEAEALGKVFDPTLHEAMGTEPTDEYPSGHVSKVFTKPYKLHDKIVRPGRVIIAQEAKKDS